MSCQRTRYYEIQERLPQLPLTVAAKSHTICWIPYFPGHWGAVLERILDSASPDLPRFIGALAAAAGELLASPSG